MPDPKGYYKILEINKDSSIEDIKKAYRRKSLAYHPDRNKNDPNATSMFQKIGEAYEVLIDSNKKNLYDRGMDNFEDSINPEDIFDIFARSGMFTSNSFDQTPFGGAHVFSVGTNGVQFSPMMQKPTSINSSLVINFEQSYNGCTLPIDIVRWTKIGNLKEEEKETIYVDIPQGIDDNEIITIKDKGNCINNNKGDIKVFIKLQNETMFERQGLDLIYNKSISLKESLCGFKFSIKHLNNKTFQINNEKGNIITPNYNKYVPNLGIKRDNRVGQLIISFSIQFPEKLSLEQIQILENNL